MGHFSPIVQQARQGNKPDAVCMVVGTCAKGYQNNETGDLIAFHLRRLKISANTFGKLFRARDGRTNLYVHLFRRASELGPA